MQWSESFWLECLKWRLFEDILRDDTSFVQFTTNYIDFYTSQVIVGIINENDQNEILQVINIDNDVFEENVERELKMTFCGRVILTAMLPCHTVAHNCKH